MSGDVRIDYQMLDLVFVPVFVSILDAWREEPPSTACIAEIFRQAFAAQVPDDH